MSETAEASKTPGESPLFTVDSDRVVLSTAEVHNFGDIDRRHVPVFALLDIEYDALGTRLEVETQTGARFEVFTVGVVSQLSVLGQSERVKTAFTV